MQVYLTFANEGKRVLCHEGENVRKVARRNGIALYRGAWRLFNCRGNGMCGSCRVQIWPDIHVGPRTPIEELKLEGELDWRLACQIHAYRDLTIWTQPGRPPGTVVEPLRRKPIVKVDAQGNPVAPEPPAAATGEQSPG